jgi:hypothetical protein
MNISLSPEDGLGRMLHTFSAQAYEISEHDEEALLNNSFIKIINEIDTNYTIILGSDESVLSDARGAILVFERNVANEI